VTIIVGIICDDAIVLASDSQTTTGTVKRCDTDKIGVVAFANVNVLVAQSGYETFSGQAVDVLCGLAKDKEITNYRMVAELAEQAMRQLKDKVRFQQGDCTMEELRDFVWKHELGCELMMAYYYEGRPYIFTIDMIVGVANRVNSFYTAIGCGGSLGSYLLSEYAMSSMLSDYAATISVFVVDKVKNHDAYCGGDTKLGIIYRLDPARSEIETILRDKFGDDKGSYIEIFTQEQIRELSDITNSVEVSTKTEQHEKFKKALLERMKKRWAKFKADRQKALTQATMPNTKTD
jgi:20S proteasome alpha/beta subunit